MHRIEELELILEYLAGNSSITILPLSPIRERELGQVFRRKGKIYLGKFPAPVKYMGITRGNKGEAEIVIFVIYFLAGDL